MPFLLTAIILVGLVVAPSIASAWSSRDVPMFDQIHQMAVENVLSNLLSADEVRIVQDQQMVVDQDQEPVKSYEHSMTGLVKAGDNLDNQMTNYIKSAEQFIRSNLLAAIEAHKATSNFFACTNLGQAIHTLTDATSPAHEGFQSWAFDESPWAKLNHVMKERLYPEEPGELKYKQALEGAVLLAYDIMVGKTALPARFFDAKGNLLPYSVLRGKSPGK